MKILIAGNLGYVGPCVTNELRASYPNAELIGFDLGLFAHCHTSPYAVPEIKLSSQVYGDVRNFPSTLLTGVDAVINLAAISNDPMGKEFEDATSTVNYKAAVELAKLCKENNVKNYVFASSCSMYGEASDFAKKENDKLNPLTAYARSKISTEQDLLALAADDFTITCCRFATACGYSERLRLDLVLNDFIAGAIANNEISILSDGTPWRPLINVKDMARALNWAATRENENGGQFLAVNTGADEWNYQVKELADAVASCIPNVKVSINTDAPPDKRSYKVDFSLFKSLAPNHQPIYNLEATINELKDELGKIDFSDKNYRESQLIRHEVLRRFKTEQLLNDSIAWQ